MSSITRTITVTRKGMQHQIQVVEGTSLLPISVIVSDYDILSGSAAVAYNRQPNGTLVNQACTISENTISFTPPEGFYLKGYNKTQVRVTNNNRNLFSFTIDVWCDENITDDADVEEINSQPTLVTQLLSQIGVLTARMDAFTALPEGSTTSDAALNDIRIGYDGTEYQTPGDAVRGQVGSLSEESMKDFGTLVDVNNYASIIPDLNDAKENKIYRLNFASGTSDCPQNLPMGFPDGAIMTLMTIRGNTDIEDVGICQILYTSKGIYKRWTSRRLSGDPINWNDWICIGNRNEKNIRVYDKLVSESNLVITDVNNINEDAIYRFNFSSSAKQYPMNMPNGFPNSAMWTLIHIHGNGDIGKVQLVFSSKNSYIRNSTHDGWTDWLTLNNSDNNSDNIIYHVKKDYQNPDATHFNSLAKAIMNSNSHTDVTIYVSEGEYDIISELEEVYGEGFLDDTESYRGLTLKNRVHIVFSSKAKVTCHYTGSNEFVLSKFSPFNSGENGFTLENINLDVSRCRYAIHDERGASTDSYQNKYLNCNIKMDGRNNETWTSPQCIGGGLGTNGEVIIKDCIFESITNTGFEETVGAVSYHNTSASDAKSKIVMSGCYIKGKGCARFSWYGQSEEKTEVIVSNNSFGSPLVIRAETSDGTSPNENIEVFSFNNEVRE